VDPFGSASVGASGGPGSSYLVTSNENESADDPMSLALSEKRVVVIDDVAKAQDLGPAQQRLLAAGIRSGAVFPIGPAEEPRGGLGVFSAEPSFFSEERLALLERLAGTVSLSADSLRRRRESEAAAVRLATSEERFRALLEHSADAIAVVGRTGLLDYLSPSFPLGGRDRPAAARDLFHPAEREVIKSALARVSAISGERATAEARSAPGSGTERSYQLILTNHLDDPAVDGVVVNIRDVTEARAAEAELRRLAIHDSLTGLANRSLLLDRVAQALTRVGQRRVPLALLYVDLDRFKQVNDRFGHAAGDEVLREVARRLQKCVGPANTVARLAADEFVLLVDDLTDEQALPDLAETIRQAVGAEIDAGPGRVRLTASLGIALGKVGDEPSDLVRSADVAMFRAKEAGGDRLAIYDEDFGQRVAERAALEEDLRRAIERGELVVAYHPIVSLDTGKVKALEALVRWVHPERGLVYPDTFIPLAEETGLVIPIGEVILSEAARQIAEWTAGGVVSPDVWVSVNVSARQLQLSDFPATVARVVAAAGSTARQVLLELTETVLGEDLELGVANATRLSEAGFGLAVDDFGTGYASLSQLKRFPVHTLKVDKSFVAGLGADPNDTSIVTAVISLARSFGIPTVAEGVETEEHAQHLARLGCDALQGYLFTPPLLGPAATEWLSRQEKWIHSDGRLVGGQGD
jgi:diguanylate cyclase (GGDEF)-like protein/PAS domain S-box-containing protein